MDTIILVLILMLIVAGIAIIIIKLNQSQSGSNDLIAIKTKLDDLQNIQQNEFASNRQENNSLNETSRRELDTAIKGLSEVVNQKLEVVRMTVDEKLQTTLDTKLADNFSQVTKQLTQVYESLGQMNLLSGDIGALKNIFSNVKNRGIFGEYMLENIITDILPGGQWEKDFSPKNDQSKVEFAVKMPGTNNSTVYLPIDVKFPQADYDVLTKAYESGDATEITGARKLLKTAILKAAKDIQTKYVNPPVTTDFAVMYLPTESLFAEVVRENNIIEELQKTYKVVLASPSTIVALLNSLNVGFRTIALEAKSLEIAKLLSAFKTEFIAFSSALEKVQTNFNTASTNLNALVTTRMNVMNRKLKDIETLPDVEVQQLLSE